MRKITEEQFLQDVRTEIEMLKLYATKEEKKNLNFNNFDSSQAEKCIYGQLTGDCRTERAYELMEKSCKRTFDLGFFSLQRHMPFEDWQKYINGEFTGKGWFLETGNRDWDYLSTLEGYIQIAPENKNKEILSYIKGTRKTLTL